MLNALIIKVKRTPMKQIIPNARGFVFFLLVANQEIKYVSANLHGNQIKQDFSVVMLLKLLLATGNKSFGFMDWIVLCR